MKFKSFLETPIAFDDNYEKDDSSYVMSTKKERFKYLETIEIPFNKTLPNYPKPVTYSKSKLLPSKPVTPVNSEESNYPFIYMVIFSAIHNNSALKILLTTNKVTSSDEAFSANYMNDITGKVESFLDRQFFTISTVGTLEPFRKRDLSIIAYLTLLKRFQNIRSDILLTTGSLAIWKKLTSMQNDKLLLYAVSSNPKNKVNDIQKLEKPESLNVFMAKNTKDVDEFIYRFVATSVPINV
jgi:hypothetical protein